MAVDKQEVEGAFDNLVRLLTVSLKNNPHPSDADIKTIFSQNLELVKKARLSDAELEEIIQIILKSHPSTNPVLFEKNMTDFKKKHLKALDKQEKNLQKKIKKQEKAQEKAEEIKKAKGKRYYYVWWLFDNETDFQTLVNDPHTYPRTRGKLKPYYKEIGTKDISAALAGEKSSGKVTGEFLGALGKVGGDREFEDIIPKVDLQEGQIIALGAARAENSDVERLIWKWSKWSGVIDTGLKRKIIGRLVLKDSWATHKPHPANHNVPPAFDWAKKIIGGDEGTGLDEHKVELEYENPPGSGLKTNKDDKTRVRTVNGKSVNGIFEFEDIPDRARIIKITSTAQKGYDTAVIEFMEDLPLILDATTQEAFVNVVLSKEKKGEPPEFVIVEPQADPNKRHEPLGPEFGTTWTNYNGYYSDLADEHIKKIVKSPNETVVTEDNKELSAQIIAKHAETRKGWLFVFFASKQNQPGPQFNFSNLKLNKVSVNDPRGTPYTYINMFEIKPINFTNKNKIAVEFTLPDSQFPDIEQTQRGYTLRIFYALIKNIDEQRVNQGWLNNLGLALMQHSQNPTANLDPRVREILVDYNYTDLVIASQAVVKALRSQKPSKSRKRKDEDVLQHLEKEVSQWMKEAKIDESATLKWHDQYQLRHLQEIRKDLQSINANHPELKNNPEFGKKIRDTLELLARTINAWEDGKLEELTEISQIKDMDVIRSIIWLKKAIEYLKSHTPK